MYYYKSLSVIYKTAFGNFEYMVETSTRKKRTQFILRKVFPYL